MLSSSSLPDDGSGSNADPVNCDALLREEDDETSPCACTCTFAGGLGRGGGGRALQYPLPPISVVQTIVSARRTPHTPRRGKCAAPRSSVIYVFAIAIFLCLHKIFIIFHELHVFEGDCRGHREIKVAWTRLRVTFDVFGCRCCYLFHIPTYILEYCV